MQVGEVRRQGSEAQVKLSQQVETLTQQLTASEQEGAELRDQLGAALAALKGAEGTAREAQGLLDEARTAQPEQEVSRQLQLQELRQRAVAAELVSAELQARLEKELANAEVLRSILAMELEEAHRLVQSSEEGKLALAAAAEEAGRKLLDAEAQLELLRLEGEEQVATAQAAWGAAKREIEGLRQELTQQQQLLDGSSIRMAEVVAAREADVLRHLSEVQRLQAEVWEAQSAAAGAEERRAAAEAELASAQECRAGAESELAAAELSHQAAAQQLDSQLQYQMQSLAEEAAEAARLGHEEAMSGMREVLEETQRELGGARVALSGAERELGGMREVLAGTQRELGGMREALAGTMRELGGARDALAEAERRDEELEEELAGLRDALAGAERRGRELSAQLQEALMTTTQIPDLTVSPAAAVYTLPPPAEAVGASLTLAAAGSGSNVAGGGDGDGWGDEDGWDEGDAADGWGGSAGEPKLPFPPSDAGAGLAAAALSASVSSDGACPPAAASQEAMTTLHEAHLMLAHEASAAAATLSPLVASVRDSQGTLAALRDEVLRLGALVEELEGRLAAVDWQPPSPAVIGEEPEAPQSVSSLPAETAAAAQTLLDAASVANVAVAAALDVAAAEKQELDAEIKALQHEVETKVSPRGVGGDQTSLKRALGRERWEEGR